MDCSVGGGSAVFNTDEIAQKIADALGPGYTADRKLVKFSTVSAFGQFVRKFDDQLSKEFRRLRKV